MTDLQSRKGHQTLCIPFLANSFLNVNVIPHLDVHYFHVVLVGDLSIILQSSQYLLSQSYSVTLLFCSQHSFMSFTFLLLQFHCKKCLLTSCCRMAKLLNFVLGFCKIVMNSVLKVLYLCSILPLRKINGWYCLVLHCVIKSYCFHVYFDST